MRRLFTAVACAVLGMTFAVTTPAAEGEDFVPLFNGRDLAGWVPVNVASNTFTVRDEMIVCDGKPTGVMRTEKMYENFVLELEYKHLVPGGNAGLFVWSDAITSVGVPFTRSIEVQILDGSNSENHTSHGDVFSIHGATMKPDRPHPRGAMRCLPSERRANPAGQWNHYRVECNDGVLKLAVNGKVVSGASECRPRKGYICLESEGGVVHYRNIRIKELPATGAAGADVARADEGFKSIYTGVDLAGWKAEGALKSHWQPKDWTLVYDGKATGPARPLWSDTAYGDFVLIADWRLSDKAAPPDADANVDGGICLRGSKVPVVSITRGDQGSGAAPGARPAQRADRRPGGWNRFIVTVRGDAVTVVLNDQAVVENPAARLDPRGPVGLLGGGSAIEFANLYVRELK